jgi:nucleoside-diphosphate-sugar epimerase
MKVLFIGGTGNISSAVSRLFVRNGVDLYHLTRGNQTHVDGVTNIRGDISKPELVKGLLKNHRWDVVVNFIAFLPADVENDFALFRDSTKQYIFISSASAYQKPPMAGPITESTPLINPFWDYSRNKIACEELLMKLYRDHGFPVTIVRPSLTYDTVIPLPIAAFKEYTTVDRIKKGLPVVVPGDGTSLWTITHSADFAEGFYGIAGDLRALGEAFHITSDEVMPWNYYYETIGAAVGVKPKLVHIPSDWLIRYSDKHHGPDLQGTLLGDKSHSAVFDNSKIKRYVPGFAAKIPFSRGIAETIGWFEADAKRQIINNANNKFLDNVVEVFSKLG